MKEEETEYDTPADAVLAAVQAGDDAKVLSLVEQLKGTSPSSAPAQDPVIEGTWRQIWSQQAEDANPLQKRLSGNQSVRLICPATLCHACNSDSVVEASGSSQPLLSLNSWWIRLCSVYRHHESKARTGLPPDRQQEY